MNSAFEHARALLDRAKDDLYVLRRLQPDPEAPRSGCWVSMHSRP